MPTVICDHRFEPFTSFRYGLTNGPVQHHLFFLCGLLLICASAVFIGAVHTRQYGHDIFVLLENGWRVINGQRPHLDYASAFGPLISLIVALGLKLSNYTVDGIGYGSAVFAFFIGMWSYLIGHGRLRPSVQILLSLCLACLVVAPYALGSGATKSSHAMLYNRYGYALLSLILFEAFLSAGYKRGLCEWLGGVSSGAAIALSLFLKASYFIVALILLFGIALLFWRLSRRRLFGLVLGFSIVSLSFLAYLNFDIRAVLCDLQMTAKAKSGSLSFALMFEKIKANAVYYPAILSLTYASFLVIENDRSCWRLIQLSLLGSLVFAADMLLLFTNAQWVELPLVAVLALLMMNYVTSKIAESNKSRSILVKYYYIAVMFIGLMIFLPRIGRDVSGIIYGAGQKMRPSDIGPVVRFTESRLRPLLLYDVASTPNANGSQYTIYINDGVALLKRASSPDDKVITMDMTNPFPYAMDRQPPTGGIACAAYKGSLDDTNHPSDEKYFGNADIVMVPKHHALDNVFYDGFYKIYEPGLNQRFSLTAETDWWYLYRRK